MESKYRHTLYASYIGYITQAIVNNLAPLLFVTFQKEFNITIAQIGFLVTYNFAIQIIVDFISVKYVEKIGYKPCIVAAHLFAFTGLVSLGIFPSWFPSPYAGLLAAITLYAIGGGLIEVLISPIVEALPSNGKSALMSLLHSFYCWGHVLVVLLSTLYFALAGTSNWKYLVFIWALVPLMNGFFFLKVPVNALSDKESALPLKQLFSMRLFWLFFLLMICSGASEQAMSQWASYFAESGLQVSKTMGDILGPCMFALLMGISRSFYGAFGERIDLKKFICLSSILCIFSYLLAVLSPIPLLSLLGCALCGLSVGIMWPGVFSLSAHRCPQGGTAMFALLALAGDIGCSGGPSLVGVVSGLFSGNIRAGLLAAVVFPVIMFGCVGMLKSKYPSRIDQEL